jgi:hypothetical protein
MSVDRSATLATIAVRIRERFRRDRSDRRARRAQFETGIRHAVKRLTFA